jgi:hypothetical protein
MYAEYNTIHSHVKRISMRNGKVCNQRTMVIGGLSTLNTNDG